MTPKLEPLRVCPFFLLFPAMNWLWVAIAATNAVGLVVVYCGVALCVAMDNRVKRLEYPSTVWAQDGVIHKRD